MTEKTTKSNEDELVVLPDFKGKETIADVKISNDLTKEQKIQVREMLLEFKDVLTDIQGETNLIEHKKTSENPIRTKQYPLPFAMNQTINSEYARNGHIRAIYITLLFLAKECAQYWLTA